jgi:FixJ family two-component response regulator
MFPARQTVVIVDDDRDVGEALMRGLAVYGYQTELFESSTECLSANVTRVATCFVIDVHLKDESGIDLLIQLGALGIEAPAIHMSGATTDLVYQKSFESGSAAFLSKPFSVLELVKTIEKVTGRPAG